MTHSPAPPEPSYAAQIVILTARILDMTPTEPLTPPTLDEALRTAITAILQTLPTAVEHDAVQLATAALPPTHAGETCGEHAIRLRTTAGWKPPHDQVLDELHRLADADYTNGAGHRTGADHLTHDLVLHASEAGAR